jgi:hypothetical protein
MTEPAMMSSQECKRQALLLMSQLEGRQMDAREAQISLIGAQVWATLATVPEPLEEVHGQLLESTEPPLPELTCPHGHTAELITDREVSHIRYTFTGCEVCP